MARSSGMTSRSRTQLPSRSVAKQASHSWLTWAPESARPSSTWSRGSNQAMPSGSLLASTELKRVWRPSSRARSSMASRGVTPRSSARSTTFRPTRSGRVVALGDRQGRPVHRQHLRAPGQLLPGPRPPGRVAVRRDPLVDGAVHELGERRPHVERERLEEVHLEHERAARDLRPHLDAVGPGPVVGLDDTLVVRDAGDGEQRGPGERPADPALEVEHLVVGDDPTGQQRDHATARRRAPARAGPRARPGHPPATAPGGRRRRCGSARRWWRSRWPHRPWPRPRSAAWRPARRAGPVARRPRVPSRRAGRRCGRRSSRS